MKWMKSALSLSLVLFLAACASAPRADDRNLSSFINWQSQGGIEIANIDEDLIVVRADPAVTPLELVNPPDSANQTVAELAEHRGYSVMINAAMFATDYVTSIGYMRSFGNINNPRFSSKLRGFLMFNPKDPKQPAVKIAGKSEIAAYNTVFQSHRMWAAKEGILWKKGASIYHHVGLVGVDGKNRVLFFYHPTLVDVHEMVDQILNLGLDLKGLLYLDGGNHGALYLGRELGQGWNTRLSLPNLLGLKPARP
jgi:hypothetical protein